MVVTCNRVQHPDCWTPCLPVTISPVGTSIFILAPYAKDVKPRIFLLPRTLYVHTLDKSHIPTRVRDAGQESGGLSQNRTVTIAYRESSPRQTQRRLCGVTIQTSCSIAHLCAFRLRVQSLLVHKFVQFSRPESPCRMSIHALFACAFDLYWSRKSFDFGGISCAFVEWIHRQLHTDQLALRLTNVCMESDCLLHADVLFCPSARFHVEGRLELRSRVNLACTGFLGA